jgi:hypothetical protein
MIIKTFIKYKNYECIVDLNSEIPPILSNTTYLYQIFTALFSILKSGFGKSGGILVQSFYINEEVIIKFITTDYIQKSVLATNNLDTELNLRIVKNLMRKHKGILKIEGTPMTGTQLIIKFPVRRDLI